MEATQLVKNLRQHGNQWLWDLVPAPGMEEFFPARPYHTNRDGEGAFLTERPNDIRQVSGTSQFSLRGMTVSGARKKIKRTFAL